MKLLTLIYVFCLFYVFIPGNVIKLPIKTSKMNIILIHALVFSVILSCTYGLIERVNLVEGMGPAEEMNERDKKKLAHAEIGGNDGVRHEVGGRGGEHKNMMKDIGRGMMGDPKPNDQSGKYGKRR